MRLLHSVVFIAMLAPGAPLVDNAYVRVTKNATPCALAADRCGDRIIVALGDITLESRKLARGEIRVFKPAESYDSPAGGNYLEVVIKPNRPAVKSPAQMIAPEKNALLYDGPTFFIFEEKLAPGETRARHSHSQRLVVVLNDTRLQQWPDGQKEIFKDQVPDDVHFNEPVIHVVKDVGAKPLRNIVIEFKKQPVRP